MRGSLINCADFYIDPATIQGNMVHKQSTQGLFHPPLPSNLNLKPGLRFQHFKIMSNTPLCSKIYLEYFPLQQQFKVAELMLLIIARCSVEWDCQKLLARDSVVKVVLPFCKSDNFGMRLGAKSSLCSVSRFIPRQQWRFLELNKHENVLMDTLEDFTKSGGCIKKFTTSLSNYYFSASDLLLLLNALVENPLNVKVIQSNICSVISQFLTNGTEMEKDYITEIVWKLCRDSNIQSFLLSGVPQIQKQLPIDVFSWKLFISASSSQLSTPSLYSGTLKMHAN